MALVERNSSNHANIAFLFALLPQLLGELFLIFRLLNCPESIITLIWAGIGGAFMAISELVPSSNSSSS